MPYNKQERLRSLQSVKPYVAFKTALAAPPRQSLQCTSHDEATVEFSSPISVQAPFVSDEFSFPSAC